jgi:hypothetical protein
VKRVEIEEFRVLIEVGAATLVLGLSGQPLLNAYTAIGQVFVI